MANGGPPPDRSIFFVISPANTQSRFQGDPFTEAANTDSWNLGALQVKKKGAKSASILDELLCGAD